VQRDSTLNSYFLASIVRRRAPTSKRSTALAPDQPEKPADDDVNAQERRIALEIRN
jgi:hypothetical protein